MEQSTFWIIWFITGGISAIITAVIIIHSTDEFNFQDLVLCFFEFIGGTLTVICIFLGFILWSIQFGDEVVIWEKKAKSEPIIIKIKTKKNKTKKKARKVTK